MDHPQAPSDEPSARESPDAQGNASSTSLSTVASLVPGMRAVELHYRQSPSSVRLHGSHFMSLRRVSRIPESARTYVAGDPVNLIDWKAYARTDQLLIREVRDEATARVRIIADASETMQWPDEELKSSGLQGGLPCKAELALRIALHLGHMHLRMGDLVELWLVDRDTQKEPASLLKPRSVVDLVAAFQRMEAASFEVQACRNEFIPHVFEGKRCDVAMYVGDGLSLLEREPLLALGRLPIFVHVLSSLELTIDWIDANTSYFDPSVGQMPYKNRRERRAQAGQDQYLKEYQGQVLKQRDNYQQSLKQWRERLEKLTQAAGGCYFLVSDQTPLAHYQRFISSLPKTRA